MQAATQLARTGVYLLLFTTTAVAQEAVIQWHHDLESAQRLAAQSNRLLLVHFWAPWCEPCLRLEREVFTQPGVAISVQQNYIAVKLNADYYSETARRLGVLSLPTDVVLGPDGQVIARLQSPPTARAFAEQMIQIAASQRAPVGGQSPSYSGYGLPPIGSPGFATNAVPPATSPYGMGSSYVSPGAPPPGSALPISNPYATFGMPTAVYGAAAGSPGSPGSPQSVAGTGSPGGTPAALQPYMAPPAEGDSRGQSTQPFGAASGSFGYEGYPSPQFNPAGPGTGYSTVRPPLPTAVGNRTVPGVPTSPAVGPRYENPQQQAPGAEPIGNPSAPGWRPGRTRAPTAPSGAAGTTEADPQVSTGSQALIPPLGMDGFCPVALSKEQKWIRGDRRWGIIHRGRTYLFASAEAQRQFWDNPDLYSPVLSGVDPVVALDDRRSVTGQRKHGIFYDGRVFLFASEASLKRFSGNPERYVNGVREAMQRAGGEIGYR